jgi:hypothetical protein
MTRVASWAGPAALALVLVAAAAFVFVQSDGLTFYVDQWDFMLQRRGRDPGVFLRQQNGHLMAVPILVHKVLFEVFGVESYVPYRLTAIAFELVVGALVFLLVRRRAGDAVAVAFAAVVLFFGPGWEPITSAVGMCNIISLAAGLGALLALDAGTRRGDVIATALLVVSVASFSYGPMFAAAAAVDILLRPGGGRRVWVALVPLAVFGLWRLGWDVESSARLANVPGVPRSLFDSAGAVGVSLTGLYRETGPIQSSVLFDKTFAPPLAILMAGALVYALRGSPRESPRLWALVVLVGLFWLSIGLSADEGRTTESSRYLYPGAVFVLLIAAELLAGVRLAWRGVAVLTVWALAVVGVGMVTLRDGGNELEKLARFDRAELAALELARGTVDPGFRPEAVPNTKVQGHYLFAIVAGEYFSAIDDYGSPAYSVAELQRAPPDVREVADLLLAAALRLSPVTGSARADRDCRRAAPTGNETTLTVPPGGLVVLGDQRQAVELRVGRFADGYPIAFPGLSGREPVTLAIPGNAARVPWHAQLMGLRAPVEVCAVP